MTRNNRLLIFFFSVLALSACNQKNEKPVLNQREYPSEWMFLQRAFPNGKIDQKAIRKASAYTQLQKQFKNSTGNWQLVGPKNTGGRITSVAISPTNENEILIGAASGGVFKTTDKGQTWMPVFDNNPRISIGAISYAPSNSQRIYVGTGEANASYDSGAFFGDGIYRSDDGGNTWMHKGLEETEHIGKIAVDPNNPDRLFAAAAGKIYGKNTERGVYRSLDGGNSWQKVFYVSDSTACIDIIINPQNSNIIFAAMWDRIRHPWGRNYAGPNSGVYKSADGGNTWAKLSNGLPASNAETGRIGLAIDPNNPAIVYASYTTNHVTNVYSGFYKSTNNGDSWIPAPQDDISDVYNRFGWYFGSIKVSPHNSKVYLLGMKTYVSNNKGTNWTEIQDIHADTHAIDFSVTNSNMIVLGNDGGLYISNNGGTSWTHNEKLPITQFYNIEINYQNPDDLLGGTQDNNTIRRKNIGQNWISILGGDGFHVNIDKNNPNYIYAESQRGRLFYSDNGWNDWMHIYSGTHGISQNDRKNWNTPVVISPFDSNRLYYGSQKLYKSTHAEYWTAISGDLTNGGNPNGGTSYGTLTAIAASYSNLNTIYTGSDDGKISVTFNGGQNWTDISAGLPVRYVTQIAISPTEDNTAYVCLSGYNRLDYAAHIFKTTNGGQNWINISGNLPNNPVNDIELYDGKIFVATDVGVWYSTNDGQNWDLLGNNLPTVIISDIKIHAPTHTIYAGTYGRSIYSYDLNNLLSIKKNDQIHFDLYPNPATDYIYFKTEPASRKFDINIFNINGQNILVKKDIKSGERINVQGLTKGIYWIKLRGETNQGIKEFIVK